MASNHVCPWQSVGRLFTAYTGGVQGNFNKMAFIKKMLNDTPRADAEWIWWTDADTLITDMAFEFPFHRRSHPPPRAPLQTACNSIL